MSELPWGIDEQECPICGRIIREHEYAGRKLTNYRRHLEAHDRDAAREGLKIKITKVVKSS